MENDGEERNRERANRERNLRENEQCSKKWRSPIERILDMGGGVEGVVTAVGSSILMKFGLSILKRI